MTSSLIRPMGAQCSASTARENRGTPIVLSEGTKGGRTPRPAITLADIEAHLHALALPEEGCAYVVGAITNPPARKVSNKHGRNLVGEFRSEIPTTCNTDSSSYHLQFESLSGEFAFAVHAQTDPEIRMILDQPTPVPLRIHDKNGRARRVLYTPDYLLVRDRSVVVVEVKPAGQLAMLCATQPLDWKCCDDTYRYLPAHEAFRRMGIEFQVVVSEALSWVRVQNIRLLWNSQLSTPTDEVRDRILRFVNQREPCSINQVVDGALLADARPVLSLIAAGSIVADLCSVSLADPNSRVLCTTLPLAKAIGRAIAALHDATTSLGQAAQPSSCHPNYLHELGYRIAVVKGEHVERSWKAPPSHRTRQRWKNLYKKGGAAALAPRWQECGRTGTRLPDWHLQTLLLQLRTDRGSPTRPTRTQSYVRYTERVREQCVPHGVDAAPVSYAHYCRLWKSPKGAVQDAYSLGGRRLACAVTPHSSVDDQVPVAIAPFQVAHIDHCLAPSFTEDDIDGRGRLPWLTCLVDDFTSEILAWTINLQTPSFELDGVVIRDCIRRHGRVPQTIISDGGADFRGLEFKACLAELGIDLIFRPLSFSRVGAPVERSFGTYATAVCAGAAGYMPSGFKVRSVSRSKHPMRLQPRGLYNLLEATEEFLMQTMPTLPGINGSPSPRDKRKEFEEMYGKQGIVRALDFAAMVATSPKLDSDARVEVSGAIRYRQIRYYSDKLHGINVPISKLCPRRDPDLPDQIYFRLGKDWHVAKSRQALQAKGRTIASARATALAAEFRRPQQGSDRAIHLHGRSTTAPSVRTAQTEHETSSPDNAQAAPDRPVHRWESIEAFDTLGPSILAAKEQSE